MNIFNGYLELELDVEYDAVDPSGDNWNEPYEPGYIEVTKVMFKSIDITDKLDANQLESIENQIADFINSEKEAALVAQAEDLESRAEMRWYEIHGY